MPISTSTQFSQFVTFATGAKSTLDIAHVDADSPLGGRSISAYKGDSVHAFTRTTDSRKANDAARELFRKAVIEIFGGEKKIPPSVRKAMTLSDFGKGRPLTARRILAVKTAIDSVKTVDAGNKKISNAFQRSSFAQLSPEICGAVDTIRAELAARGGPGMPADRNSFLKFIGENRAKLALDSRAEEKWRPLTPHDVRKALRSMIKNDRLLEVSKLTDYMSKIGAAKIGVSLSRASVIEVMTAVPGLDKDLRACKRAADFEAVFAKRGAKIEAHLQIMAEAARVKARSADMVVEEFVKATGRDEAYFREYVPLAKFKSDVAEKIREKIATGALPMTSVKQVEAAFRDVALTYVREHIAVANQADGVADVSDAVRRSLRHGAIVAQDVKAFKISEFAPLASKLDIGPLREVALRKPFSVAAVAPVLRATAESLAGIGKTHCGAGAWLLMGVDGQQPFANIVIKCALSGEPELAKILAEHSNELMNETAQLIPPEEGGTMSMLTGTLPAIKELAAEL